MTDSDRAAFRAHVDVSRETEERLQSYESLLRKWTAKINLVSPASLEALWTRHFLDSAQLWSLSDQRGHWVDLGSGGGFPGLVVAILGDRSAPITVTLVEADQRKAAFLRNAIRELALTATVIARRIEEIAPLEADILSARALAPLSQLLAYAERHRKPSGLALFPKGEKVGDELSDALESWRFDCQKHPSITDARSTVLSVGEISRV